MYYLAYGSNLNLKLLLERCPSAKIIGTTQLQDFALVFKGDGEGLGYLTIEEETGSVVPVGIYEISQEDINALDIYEGYPYLYDKRKVKVKLQNQEITGSVYIMDPVMKYHLPSVSYFITCIKGYQYFDFDYIYLRNAFRRTERLMKQPNR